MKSSAFYRLCNVLCVAYWPFTIIIMLTAEMLLSYQISLRSRYVIIVSISMSLVPKEAAVSKSTSSFQRNDIRMYF